MTESGFTASVRATSPGRALDGAGNTAGARLARRDTSALEELYDRVSPRAFGLAYRILGEPSAAEDVVHDAFAWLWDNCERVNPERGSVDSLLMTIVHRRAIDAVRARTRRSALGMEAVRQRMALETGDAAADAELLTDSETVSGLLKKLPEEQRTAIEMAYFQGMTHAEIATSAGVPLGTVKGRLRLAMKSLRQAFGIGGVS